MKYVLLKDLPFAEVGEIIEIDEGSPIRYKEDGLTFSCDFYAKDQLMKDGWIKEVLPTIRYILKNGNSYGKTVFETQNEAHDYMFNKGLIGTIVKFKEDLE